MRTKFRRKGIAILLILAMVIGLMPAMTITASAGLTTVYVNSNTGSDITGDGTSANPYKTFAKGYSETPSGQKLDLTGTFTWTDPEETGDAPTTGLTISKNITIQGHGAGTSIIQAGASCGTNLSRVFTVSNGTLGGTPLNVTFNNLEIRHGYLGASDDGGALNIQYATVSINNSYIHHNKARQGFAIESGNSHLTINNSTISENSYNPFCSGFAGGAINAQQGSENSYGVTITNSTVFGNTGAQYGGGLCGSYGVYYVTNCTFANNSCQLEGAGISIAGNTGGPYGTIYIKNTIVANNTSLTVPGDADYDDAYGGSTTDNGNNLVGYTNSTNIQSSETGAFDLSRLNLSDSLAVNGASNGVPTLALSGGSTVAINSGSPTANGAISIPATDQRGFGRSSGLDIGAFEYLGINPSPTVTTQAVTDIAATTATANGNITALGSPNPTAYGVCWNTTGTPTTASSGIVNKGGASATGAFTAAMTGLAANTTYYVRAYVTNAAGTAYGNQVTFTTAAAAPTSTTEKFTTETVGATTFSEGGATFSINGGKLKITTTPDYGLDDNVFVENSSNEMTAAGSVGSFQCSTNDFYANSLYLITLDQDHLVRQTNDIIIRGKLDGVEQFTHTVLYSDISTIDINRYYTFVDLSSKSSYAIDELEFVVDPYEDYYVHYLMIDDFKFTVIPVADTAPTITTDPSAKTVAAGSNTSFTVEATGTGLTYQWQVNNGEGYVNIANGGVYSNATTATLSITGATVEMNDYLYRAIVGGTVAPAATSSGAKLTVTTSPEINIEGNGTSIASGDTTPTTTDHTDFGSVSAASGTVVRTFTICNTGSGALNLSGTPKVTVGGANASDFTVTTEPVTPVAATTGTTTFQITFDPSGVGNRSAAVSIANNDSNENPYTFAIQGTGANTAPTVSGLPADITVTEDVLSNVDLSAATFSDTDGDSLMVTLTASAGTFTSSSGGGVTISGSGTGTLTLSGSAANINAFLDTASNVKYTGAANVNGDNAAIFTVKANDGTADSSVGTVNIDVSAINDNPGISGLPSDITVTENEASDVDLSAATFADIDSGVGSVTLTITAGAGVLSATSGAGVTVAGSGTATLSLNGTAANIDSYLNIPSNVKYRGPADLGGNNATTLVLVANDGGNTGTGGGGNVSLGSVNLDITPVSPIVTNVSSNKADAVYGIGEVIDIALAFSKAVTVVGTPQLTLETGTVDRTATYISGSGTNSLTFRYATQSGDESADLDYTGTNALFLNGGSIKSAAGGDLLLALPAPGAAGSLGENKAIVINAFPAVTLSVGSASIAEAAGTSTITATLSQISSQDVVVTLSYSGTATKGTDYNNSASTSIAISAGSLSANAATGITVTQDNDAEGPETIIVAITAVSKGIENTEQEKTITILDDDISSVTSVSSTTANGSYKAGDSIAVTVAFSHPVTVTGTPRLLLEAGTTDQAIVYSSGSGTNTLTFVYTVQTGDTSMDLDYANANALTLNGGTISSGGVSAILTLPVPGAAGSLKANKAIVIDTSAPLAPSTPDLTAGSDSGTLSADNITNDTTPTFTGTAEAASTVRLYDTDGTTQIGSATADGSGNWTITASVLTAGTHSVTAKATDAAGNVSAASSALSLNIDTVAPTATITMAENALTAGETSLVTITFSEAVTGFANADLTIENGVLSAVSTTDGGITFTATFTPAAGVKDLNNTLTLSLPGVQDAAGNTGMGTAASGNYAVNTALPTATVVMADSALKIGETSLVTITFSEAVTDFTNADLTIPNGTLSPVTSADGNVSFTATFTPSNDTQDSTNEITLAMTGLQNAAGNSGSGTVVSGNYAVDTLRPTATVDVTDTALKAGETTLVTIAFSEAVTGLDAADFTVSNGAISALGSADGNVTFTGTLTPSAGTEDASNIISLDKTGIQDLAGNSGSGMANSNNYAMDTLLPTAVITMSKAALYSGGTATVTIAFSEAITGLTDVDFTVPNGSISGIASADGGITFTATFTADSVDDDTNSIVLALTGISDAAGNAGSGTASSANYTIAIATAPGVPTAVTAAAGNGQVTVTFTPPVSNGGAPITGYTVTSSPGGITATGTGSAITVTGLTNGTAYTFTVTATNAVGTSAVSTTSDMVTPSGGSSGSSQKPPTNTVVEVNGQKQDAGTSSTKTEGGKTITTIKVDDAKIGELISKSGEAPKVTLPNTGSDVTVGELNGQTVKNMESKEAVLEIKTESVSYTLPAAQINIGDVSTQFGTQVELKDIKVSISIAEPPADTVKIVEDTANKNSYQLVVKPVEFEITCTSGDKTVAVSKFNGYVERTVAIPDGVDPSKITTGIVLNADGTFTHVPTSIVVINGKYYAKINSLTNSTYSVIYNPVEFADVANHWAKAAVNDMGSRMVVSGMDSKTYDPDSDITRAQFAAIIIRALGLQEGAGSAGFKDVRSADWYAGAVKTATEYGIISGYGNGSFGPNDKITREQAMAMIARAMKLTKLDAGLGAGEAAKLLAAYKDGVTSAAYAKTSIAECLKTGIVTGNGGGILAPKDYITRAEVAVMAQKLLQKSNLI